MQRVASNLARDIPIKHAMPFLFPPWCAVRTINHYAKVRQVTIIFPLFLPSAPESKN